MSEAYVVLVNRALEAVIRGDYREASDCFRPDAEWHNTRQFPGPLTCVGPRAIIDFWTTLVESFDVRDPVSGARMRCSFLTFKGARVHKTFTSRPVP